MKKKSSLKGLIVGCGSIGERHLHNLKHFGIDNIAICDYDRKRINELSLRYRTEKFCDLDSALSLEPDFTFICTYPTSHMPIANSCVDANSHIFIEKPISSNPTGVENLLKKARTKGLKIAIGYNMRFEPGLNLMKQKLLRNTISTPISIFSEWGHNIKLWRPGTNFRSHYVLKKGSGIILDDSHEYDYMRWLLDDDVKSVYCQTKKITSIKTQTESIASIIMRFRKGTVGTLVIDYVRPNYERKCHIIGEKGDLKWAYQNVKSSWKNYGAMAKSIITTNILGKKPLSQNSLVIRSNDMYVHEAENFIQSILEDKKPLVDGWEGLKTLRIGFAALESARQNKVIRL